MTEIRRDDERFPRIEREQPQLPEGWTELRRAKASAKTGWTYYRELVKLLHDELGEKHTATILCRLMKAMAHRYFDASMKKFGAEDCFEEEVVRTHNPAVRVYCRSLLTWGDPYCETVFEEVG